MFGRGSWRRTPILSIATSPEDTSKLARARSRGVRLQFHLCRSGLVLAGLSCLFFGRPGQAYAQAEELPPEKAAEWGVALPPPAPPPSGEAAEPPRPPPQAAPARSLLSRILFVPYLGFSIPVGDGWAGMNPSPRFGALFGLQVTERLLAAGEIDIDYARPDVSRGEGQASNTDFWDGFFSPPRYYLDFTTSPLVSFRAGQVRLGPKIGWFTSRGHDEMAAPGSGLLFGFNFGLFVPYRRVSFGGLFTGSFRVFTSTREPYGAHHTMGLLAAVLL
jgi:hypothetical protein